MSSDWLDTVLAWTHEDISDQPFMTLVEALEVLATSDYARDPQALILKVELQKRWDQRTPDPFKKKVEDRYGQAIYPYLKLKEMMKEPLTLGNCHQRMSAIFQSFDELAIYGELSGRHTGKGDADDLLEEHRGWMEQIDEFLRTLK